MRICELRMKEVINICDGKRLGFITDVEIDSCTGCVVALIVPGPGKLCSFLGRDTEYIIPWKCVKQIGNDIILVEIDEDECKKKCDG